MTTPFASLITNAKASTGIAPVITNVYYTTGDSYNAFCSKNGIEDKLASLFSYSLVFVSGINFKNYTGTVPSGFVLTTTIETLDSAKSAAARWIVELVLTTQVGQLNERNIENYYKSMGSDVIPWKVEDILRYLATKMPKLTSMPGVSDIIDESTWTYYHSRASSTPSLIRRAIASSPFPNILNDEEMAALADAEENPFSVVIAQAIPPRALVITSIVLKACDSLPNDWYMGKKAVQDFSPSKYSSLLAIMKQAIKVESGVGDVDVMTDIMTLSDMFNQRANA